MRKNLGSLVLFFSINLLAMPCEWSSFANKNSAFVGESIYVRYEAKCEETFEISLKIDERDFLILKHSQGNKVADGKNIENFEFILKPKYDAKLTFAPKASIDGKSGNNPKALEFDIKRPPTKLVGEFNLEVIKGDEKLMAYEPFNLELKIDGVGNFDDIDDVNFSIDGVKVFSDTTSKKLSITKDAQGGEWSKKFAFVSDKNFSIDGFSLEYFDLNSSKVKTLTMPKIDVKIEGGYDAKDLIDKKEEFDLSYLYYFLTFLIGILVGVLLTKIEIKRFIKADKDDFLHQVRSKKSLKDLMIFLALQNDKRHEKVILAIELGEIKTLKVAIKKIKEIRKCQQD